MVSKHLDLILKQVRNGIQKYYNALKWGRNGIYAFGFDSEVG